MTLLTAATIKRTVLEPSLDALALNGAQARLIQNDTPEADSVIEHLAALAPIVRETRAVPNLVQLFDQTISLRDWNRSEGDRVRVVTGHADGMVTDLRTLELSGSGGASPLTAKALVRALRAPLRMIAEPSLGDPRAWVDAGRQVGEILARTPEAQLFHPAVTRELGKAKAAALRELYERRETKGAATPAKGPGAADPRGVAHGRASTE